jgi:hypothetical protein
MTVILSVIMKKEQELQIGIPAHPVYKTLAVLGIR